MSVKISTYAGKIGWMARKYLPNFSSNAYLKLQYLKREKTSQNYIKHFCESEIKPQPLNFLIETVNRCNSTCEFCAANKNEESRPFCKMPDELFYKIIHEIAEWDYEGYISLYVNNEPFIDPRIIEFHKYVREKLPKAKIKLFTNGLLVTVEKFMEILPYVDLVIINNYCDDMKLHKNVEELYSYLVKNPEVHKNVDIQIKVRYIKEVLTNRAGTSPNKKVSKKRITESCLFPYTDMVIYPDGKVGLCCCDVKEVTNLGNVNSNTVQEIWNGEKFSKIREAMKNGRNGNGFCQYCDFVDAGLRVKIIKSKKVDR